MKLLKFCLILTFAVICFCVTACKNNVPLPDSENIKEDIKEGTAETQAQTIKILGIGNGFTVNVFNEYVYRLAKAGGKRIVIAYLTIGGAPLEMHAFNAKNNSKVYQYLKKDNAGKVFSASGKSIEEAVADQEWDYICFQQQSRLSGQIDSYKPHLKQLVSYVTNISRNPDTVYALMQTWVYAYDFPYSSDCAYNNNQLTMYKSLVSAAEGAASLVAPKMMIIHAVF